MLGAAFVVTAAQGRPPEPAQDATVTMACRSIRLGSGTGTTDLAMVFSTPGTGSRWLGNGEFRPSAVRPGFYEAGYTILDNSGTTPRHMEAGTVYVPIPNDEDNTLPDTADQTMAVDVVLRGEAVPNGAFLATRVSQSPFSLHLQRGAGSDAGSYTTDLLPGADLHGDYSVLHAEGTVQYRRTDTGALLNFSLSNAMTNAFAAGRVLDSNTVRVAAFRVRVSADRKVRVGPATLNRAGNLYRGEASLSDGLTETAAADFRSWFVQITDLNDANSDGVPDFSDFLLPVLAAQPHRQFVAAGDTATFSVTVEGAGPFTYEWQQNGHGLSNTGADATSRVLVIHNVTPDDKGSYRVRVTNATGTVISDSTSLSLR